MVEKTLKLKCFLNAYFCTFSFFSPEYSYILENAEILENQFKRQPNHLERLYGKGQLIESDLSTSGTIIIFGFLFSQLFLFY